MAVGQEVEGAKAVRGVAAVLANLGQAQMEHKWIVLSFCEGTGDYEPAHVQTGCEQSIDGGDQLQL